MALLKGKGKVGEEPLKGKDKGKDKSEDTSTQGQRKGKGEEPLDVKEELLDERRLAIREEVGEILASCLKEEEECLEILALL